MAKWGKKKEVKVKNEEKKEVKPEVKSEYKNGSVVFEKR